MDSGEWSAIAEWTAIGLSVAGAVYANWKAKRARDVAGEATDAQIRMADALDRIADARPPASPAREDEEPEVDLVDLYERVKSAPFIVEPRRGQTYSLRNVHNMTLTGIQVKPPEEGVITRDLPDGITLENLQSHTFLMTGTWGHPAPRELVVRCDQLPEPVTIPVPERF